MLSATITVIGQYFNYQLFGMIFVWLILFPDVHWLLVLVTINRHVFV